MSEFDDAQNSNWGSARQFSSADLIAISSSIRPRDFFLFVPEKPREVVHPVHLGGGRIVWHEAPERHRATKMADVITLNLWAQVSNEEGYQADNSGALIWCEVEWGSGGTSMTARVDVGRGTQLVIPADAIVVRLGVDALPPIESDEEVPWAPLPITINALVGKRGAQSWKPRRSLIIADLKGTGGVQTLRIPDFAWGVRLAGTRSELTSAGITVKLLSNDATLSWTLDTWTALMLKDPGEYKPLPNGAEYIQITNNSGQTIDLALFEFALTL